ncbi:MAG: glycosyltransferase [Anaerolineales bacterium]|jgi:processive 1,2-diacylglycerol beta-glucosyltransferase
MAAQALESAIRREAPQLGVQTLDPLTESIEVLPLVLERLQAASIILTPAWADRVWRRGNPPGLTDRMLEFGGLQKLVADKLMESQAEVAIATHVLPCLLAASLKERNGAPRKVYGVVTDWGVHRFWPMTGVDGYFVAHEDVRQTLIYRGIDPGIVHVTGIPIRLGFERFEKPPPDRSGKGLRVLVLVGGLQVGAYVGLQQNLIALVDAIQDLGVENLELTIITGKSRGLRRMLNRRVKRRGLRANVLGLVDDMHDLMAQHDILITKPGGLIVAEGLASGICLILFRPGPGQEEANVDFLARHGGALCGETPDEIVGALQRCVEDVSLVRRMKAQARELGRPCAAKHAASTILQDLT